MHVFFVVLDLVFQYLAKRLSGKNISERTNFMLGRNLNLSLGLSSSMFTGREPLEINRMSFLWARCPSCHSVEALKETKNIYPNQWNLFRHSWTSHGRGIVPFMPTV